MNNTTHAQQEISFDQLVAALRAARWTEQAMRVGGRKNSDWYSAATFPPAVAMQAERALQRAGVACEWYYAGGETTSNAAALMKSGKDLPERPRTLFVHSQQLNEFLEKHQK